MSLRPATNLGRYEIRALLGAGGMGEVYLAQDTRLNRRVALKLLPAQFTNDASRLHRFEQEAFAASALNHPNIITIYEIGEEADAHFMAMELIEGKTLREHAQSKQMSLAEVLDIAVQVASALAAAHAAGIVHRDIKPENIMLRADGYVKVLDFGLAKLTERETSVADAEAPTRPLVQTAPGVIIGTVYYMSPEQARGIKMDARTDIWSFGIVLYEMIAGHLPLKGETTTDALAAILKTEPSSLSTYRADVPAELQRIVTKMLRKNADERYQTTKDLLVDLRSLKQELEFQEKLERTNPPKAKSIAADASTSDTITITAETKEQRPTSSAEYVAGEIKKHKRSFAFVLIILLLAATGFGYWFFIKRSANAKQIESIAVLPFVNESGSADTEYLSDGMTESLISSLSQLPKLNVKARSSVFRYKGKEADAQRIGKELNVQAILTGRVVQRSNELTLYIELIDAATENVLWKADYSQRMTNLAMLQNEIARDVSNKLKVKLSGVDEQRLAKNYTENAEAYQLYLQGNFHRNKRTPKDLQKSIEYFNQAIEKDRNYALAYAGLADAYALLANFSGNTSHDLISKAREATLKALALDEQLSEAHATLGYILGTYDYDFIGAQREYKRAIELNPNDAAAHQYYGRLLTFLGRHEESSAEFRRALELDPVSLSINRVYGESLINARKYDESLAQLKKTLELDANFAQTHFTLATAYQLQGNYAGSVEEFAKFQELFFGESQNAALTRESFAKGGWQGFLRMMTGKHRPANLPSPSYFAAICHVELGEKDRAFAELNKAYENHDFFFVQLKVDPRLDPLRDDPRFQDLLRRVGFTP